MAPKYLDQCDLGLVEFPARGQKPAILVAVGIAEHHFLHAAAAVEQARVFAQAQQFIHHITATAQIFDRFEQRHDIEIERSLARPQKTCFLEEHRSFENVGSAGGLRNHVMWYRGAAVAAMRLGGRAQDRQLALSLGRIREKGRSQRAGRPQFRQ